MDEQRRQRMATDGGDGSGPPKHSGPGDSVRKPGEEDMGHQLGFHGLLRLRGGDTVLGGVGFPDVIWGENGILRGEARGGVGREIPCGESFRGTLPHRYYGVLSGRVCGDYSDPHSGRVAREDEHSRVDAVCAALAYSFLHRHCLQHLVPQRVARKARPHRLLRRLRYSPLRRSRRLHCGVLGGSTVREGEGSEMEQHDYGACGRRAGLDGVEWVQRWRTVCGEHGGVSGRSQHTRVRRCQRHGVGPTRHSLLWEAHRVWRRTGHDHRPRLHHASRRGCARVGGDLMGLVSGSVPWYTMTILHNKLPFLKQVDDPMAVFHTHAVAGVLGGLLTGVFAVPKLCRLFYMVPDWDKYVGLAYGLQNGKSEAGLRQMAIQVGGMVFVVIFNFVSTTLVCLLVGLVVPLRLDTDALQVGDKAVHGEEAFAFYAEPVAKLENMTHNTIYDNQDFSFVGGHLQMV
ncbi:hypothetical protein Fmac_007073 [Flemingia macrophylla]|uniref:Ammonium transporter AmtB-like domain-containing protein n=1 Tax=Flemingia macrophylla TaxID=520843 RepID=A0ABD1NCY6_9FABA